jgi:hypothetical protein
MAPKILQFVLKSTSLFVYNDLDESAASLFWTTALLVVNKK